MPYWTTTSSIHIAQVVHEHPHSYKDKENNKTSVIKDQTCKKN